MPRPSRRSRHPLLLALPVALAACGGGGGDDAVTPPPSTGAGARDSVFMPGNSFSPFSITIKAGESVAWVFPREAHNVIFARLASGQANPLDILPVTNTVVTRKFETAGTFPYDCTLHAGMRGEVIVTR